MCVPRKSKNFGARTSPASQVRHRTIGADDGTNCDSCKGKVSYSNNQTFSKLYTSCYITLIQLRVRMFPLLYLKARRSSTSCSKILAETS